MTHERESLSRPVGPLGKMVRQTIAENEISRARIEANLAAIRRDIEEQRRILERRRRWFLF